MAGTDDSIGIDNYWKGDAYKRIFMILSSSLLHTFNFAIMESI